jgi:hypothetical protein
MSKEQSVSIPVFWMMVGDGTIHQSNAVSVLHGRVEFDDGGWNPAEDCFFSEEQCRTYHGLPPKDWTDSRNVVREKLEALIEELTSAATTDTNK